MAKMVNNLKHMVKIALKDDYNTVQKRYKEASSSVAGASIRIMTSHFVALYHKPAIPQKYYYPTNFRPQKYTQFCWIAVKMGNIL